MGRIVSTRVQGAGLRPRHGSAHRLSQKPESRLSAAFLDRKEPADQRWRALKRGLDLQITKTLPRRRTTLQSRWRVFADLRDERTFMGIPGNGSTKKRNYRTEKERLQYKHLAD